jgi:hypothetical protein
MGNLYSSYKSIKLKYIFCQSNLYYFTVLDDIESYTDSDTGDDTGNDTGNDTNFYDDFILHYPDYKNNINKLNK